MIFTECQSGDGISNGYTTNLVQSPQKDPSTGDHSSVVEHWLSVYETQGSIPGATNGI